MGTNDVGKIHRAVLVAGVAVDTRREILAYVHGLGTEAYRTACILSRQFQRIKPAIEEYRIRIKTVYAWSDKLHGIHRNLRVYAFFPRVLEIYYAPCQDQVVEVIFGIFNGVYASADGFPAVGVPVGIPGAANPVCYQRFGQGVKQVCVSRVV